MSTEAQELLRTYEQLAEAKRVEVADFARFLLEREGDARWERIVTEPTPRPRLDAFLKASRAEGSGPLDSERL